MLDILSITGVIFVLIGTGFVSVKMGVFNAADMASLGKFVINIALPALILRAVSSRPVSEIADVGYLGAVLFGSLLVFGFGYFWSRKLLDGSIATSTCRAMGMSCANSGFVGYPVLLMALPDVAGTALALNMIVENLFIIPLILVLGEYSNGMTTKGSELARQLIGRLFRNPIVIALLVGLAVSLSGIELPDVIDRPIDIFASASAAVSLVVIGGTLAALPLRMPEMSVLVVVAGKLVLHPLAVAGGVALMAAFGFGIADERLAAAAIIMAASPVMSIYPILAQKYGEGQAASLALLVMTVLSFITISIALAVALP